MLSSGSLSIKRLDYDGFHPKDISGVGSLYINNIVDVTDDNRISILNCKTSAELLCGKTFTKDVVIELLERRKDVTGTSWEMLLTLGLTSLLTGTPLQEGITGTGRIGQNGKVLEVSSYAEKCFAAYQAHYTISLVPQKASQSLNSWNSYTLSRCTILSKLGRWQPASY